MRGDGCSMSRAFDLAYSSLKMQIVSGALRPGQHININTIASTIRISTSPMREALCTLSAEGLLESTKGSGFHVPLFEFTAVSDLLKWSDHLARQCVKAGKSQKAELVPRDVADHLSRVTILFQGIGRMAGNAEIAKALTNAALRLNGLYRTELAFLPDADDELDRIEDGLTVGAHNLPRLLHTFHRRRVAILPKIMRAQKKQ